MKPNGSIVRHILIWSYERGTLQYDIICALILAFIFFIPPSCFHKRQYNATQSLEPSSQASHSRDIVKDQRDANHENK